MSEFSEATDTEEKAGRGRVVAVQPGLVAIEIDVGSATSPLMKNEVVYVCPAGSDERLRAEVLRVRGNLAEAQVYEETRGVAVGDPVIQAGEMLSVSLGPGLLGQVYDGLQNPLEAVAAEHGFFLPRGVSFDALQTRSEWPFTPVVQAGQTVAAGDVLGTVQEGRFEHRIMVPFAEPDEVEVTWVKEGTFGVDAGIVGVRDTRGNERSFSMRQRWPVRKPLTQDLFSSGRATRVYPSTPMITTQRLVDTFFPIALGGSACIPGPFGAGKTVLQNLISRYSDVDIVIVVACGERAGEVVETITEFPRLPDPHTGGVLMDRTIIICNTSSMPVAAREASIYTGITLGEYYRQMGYNVLLLADSTSRWAQAMRETSGRLEEIPGEEAFPAYLDSSFRMVYERAGVVQTPDGSTGSLTMIGTVSPAGGNFDEPVTQSTLGTVKCFLGLSADRAYKRFYPAIDPLLSWSRYLEQLSEWFDENVEPGWTRKVSRLMDTLKRGDEVFQMMQVTGEDGVSLEDFVAYQKAVLIDMVYLQQDAFDEVDASTPLDRQKATLDMLDRVVRGERKLSDNEEVRDHYVRLTGLFKNLNYTPADSGQFPRLVKQIEQLI